MQPRSVTALEHLNGVLALADGQQRREVADVLLEEIEDRGDPAVAEPHAGPHSLGLQLLGPRVGGLLEQGDARLAPELLAEEEGRVRRDRDLRAGDRLRRVPVLGERLGLHQLVQLHTRTGRLRGDRVRERGQSLGAGDRDLEVLPARGEDLLVEQLVARILAEAVRGQVLLGDRRQDPDEHHVGADRARVLLGAVEARPHLAFELGEHPILEQAGRDVDLDVELAQLGLEVGVGDRLEGLGVDHGRVAGVVGEVELDLEPHRAPLGVEARFAEHAREHVEARAHFLAVALPVLARKDLRRYFLAHELSLPRAARRKPGPPARGRQRRRPCFRLRVCRPRGRAGERGASGGGGGGSGAANGTAAAGATRHRHTCWPRLQRLVVIQ